MVAVVLVTAAAGCGKEADGSSSEPSRSSSTSSDTSKATATPSTSTPGTSEPSKESGPKPPRLPDKAKGTSAKSAAHFVEYYIELMNYSAATGDTKAMRAASRDCVGCMNYIRLYERTHKRGGFFANPRWVASNFVAERERQHVVVLFDVTAPKSRYKLKAGDEVKTGRGGHYKLRFWVQKYDGTWRVRLLAEQVDAP